MDKLLLPKFGQTMEEGSIVEWFIKEGDTFDIGAELYEVETEKTNVTVEATLSGRLHKIVQHPGAPLPIGTLVAVVAATDEEVSTEQLAQFLGDPAAEPTPTVSETASQATSGPLGGPAVATTTQLEGVRLQTVRVVTESWRETPHFQQVVLADATNLVAARAELVAKAEPASLNDLLLDRIVSAVVEVPDVNASYHDGVVTQYTDVNIAIAVATDRGLVAPVVHRCNDMTLAERTRALRELTSRGLAGSLQPTDMENATITVSNLGMFGVDTGFALVTRPQGAIVFVGTVCERPMVINGAVVARQSVYLSVSYDHRVVDGAAAAKFVTALRRNVEQ